MPPNCSSIFNLHFWSFAAIIFELFLVDSIEIWHLWQALAKAPSPGPCQTAHHPFRTGCSENCRQMVRSGFCLLEYKYVQLQWLSKLARRKSCLIFLALQILLSYKVLWRRTSRLSWSSPKTPGRGMLGVYQRQTQRAGPASCSWDQGSSVIFPQSQWLAIATGCGSGSEFLGARRVHIASNMFSSDFPPFVPNLQVTLSSWEKDD